MDKNGARYRYVLFDLDGTLTDSGEGITKCVQYALKKAAGIEVTDMASLRRFVGPPLEDSFREFYHMEEALAKEAVRCYRERFSAVGMFENRVYDGMPETLRALREQGVLLGVATSKPAVYTEKILEKFQLLSYFSAVAGARLDGAHSTKPELIARALEMLGAAPEEWSASALMIGDRKFDIEGAKAVGIDSVGVTYGFAPEGELEACGATYYAAAPARLLELVLHGGEKLEEAGTV